MANPPKEAEDPKFVVHPSYVDYTEAQRELDKRSGHLTSAYSAYDPNGEKGTHIDHGTPVPGQRYKEYPARTELAQTDPGYDRAHPHEKRLPKDVEGRRNVYGVHEGMPLEGPVDWKEFYKKWPDVGPQLKSAPIAAAFDRVEALNQSELDFCRKYGFEFKEKLGEGGFGSVWTVDWHQKDSKGNSFKETYAVKIIDIESFRRKSLHDATALMLKEATITKNLDHDNIVKVENVFHIHEQETGFPMVRVLLFMTLCDGDLHNFLYKRWSPYMSLTEDEARLVMWDVCQGLKYLHDQNITHLDIKPNNILIKKNPVSGQIVYKLSDFGYSEMFSSADTKIKDSTGTERYCGPEMDQGYYDCKQADIFALGSTLGDMLCGFWHMIGCRKDLWPPDPDNPIKNFTPDQTKMKSLQRKWKLSFQALDLIRKMTVLEPERRITIDQVIADEWFNESNPISSADCTLS